MTSLALRPANLSVRAYSSDQSSALTKRSPSLCLINGCLIYPPASSLRTSSVFLEGEHRQSLMFFSLIAVIHRQTTDTVSSNISKAEAPSCRSSFSASLVKITHFLCTLQLVIRSHYQKVCITISWHNFTWCTLLVRKRFNLSGKIAAVFLIDLLLCSSSMTAFYLLISFLTCYLWNKTSFSALTFFSHF